MFYCESISQIIHGQIKVNLEDFYKPKIVWTAVNAEYKFCYVPEGIMLNNALFMVTGTHIQTLLAIFNSKTFKFYLKLLLGESYQYGAKDSFDKIPVLQVSDIINKKFDMLVKDIQHEYTYQKANDIDSMIFDLYNLSLEERKVIGSVEIQ